MILSEKQAIFALNAAKLILWISEQPGYRVTFNEAYRTKEQAAIYASQGKGISIKKVIIRDNGALTGSIKPFRLNASLALKSQRPSSVSWTL